MTDLAETPDERTQEWSPNARGCPQSDVEPHGSTPRKPLVIESVSSTLRIEGRPSRALGGEMR